MPAAVLIAPNRLDVRDVPTPAAPPGSVNVAVDVVGICGTDVGIYRGKIPVRYPRVLGHEVVGRTLDHVEGGPPAGTRVVVDPNVSCGRCARCVEGRQNLCPFGGLLGRDFDGGLSPVVEAPAANLHLLPDGIADHVAPLIQVLTTCVHGQRLVDVFPSEAVVVLGLGVTGLLHVQLARLRGAAPVVGVTRDESRRRLALELGAQAAVAADDERVVDLVRELTGGGADVVIECAGTIATLARAVELIRPGGRILAYGTIAEAGGPFPFYDLYYKEAAIMGARAATARDFPVAVEAVAAGDVRLDPLVGRRIDLEEVPSALASGSTSGLKTVVHVGVP